MVSLAISTLDGRIYYELSSELKRRWVPFLSLKPDDPIPLDVEVVITTSNEKGKIKHPRVSIYDGNASRTVERALELAHGGYSSLIVGLDPGKRTGVVVMADGQMIRGWTEQDIRTAMDSVLDAIGRYSAPKKLVRVGDAIDKSRLAELVIRLPYGIGLELVSEKGTTAPNGGSAADILSAMKIALREGQEVRRT